jgi:pimeloyl-ACP methyl ester carboxylesterase
MARVFRSDRGRQLVQERYRQLLDAAPLRCDELRISTREGDTFVLTAGADTLPPLLLFHGGATCSAMWLNDLPLLSQHFRVHAIDMIGEPGFSAPSRPPMRGEAHALWLDEVWNALGLTQARIAAASQGGWLALDYAIRRPQRVQSLALVAPAGVTRQRVGMALRVAPLMMFGEWGRRRVVEYVMGGRADDLPREARAFFEFFLLTQAHFAHRTSFIPVFDDAQLASLKVPVLAIVGARDVVFRSANTLRRLKARVAHAQTICRPEAGHGLTDYAVTLRDFFLSDGCG